jgi:tripartite-type tricarboxylate transporter receptor subunit TctC
MPLAWPTTSSRAWSPRSWIVFNPALVGKLPYSSLQDLAPISMLGSFPLVLAVHDPFPARHLSELVAYSKAHRDKTSYSYPAASFQLIMELLKSRSGLQALHVPYQGSAPSINALLTQEVQMTLIDSDPVAAMLRLWGAVRPNLRARWHRRSSSGRRSPRPTNCAHHKVGSGQQALVNRLG